MKPIRRIIRAFVAAGLSAAVLYTVAVTAGAQDAAGAVQALAKTAPLTAVQWEVGDFWPRDGLGLPTVLALAQSPLLISARKDVAQLRRQREEMEAPIPAPPAEVVEETPLEAPPAQENGVEGRTLVPSSPEGYTVSGLTYISNTSDHDLSQESLDTPFAAALGNGDPQILILHSHGSEGYTPVEPDAIVWSGDHRTTDSRCNVLLAGDAMAEVFAQAGISVLHDRTLYDYPNYTGAYDRSLASIQAYLTQYPSIRFILDVHRDAVEDSAGTQYKVVCDTEAGKSAQLTLVVGSDGSAEHPLWRENLRLGVAIQNTLLAQHPQLCRPLLLRASRYNQHASTGSLLVEVGAAGNDPREAQLAAQLFAQGMVEVLQEGAAPSQPDQ